MAVRRIIGPVGAQAVAVARLDAGDEAAKDVADPRGSTRRAISCSPRSSKRQKMIAPACCETTATLTPISCTETPSGSGEPADRAKRGAFMRFLRRRAICRSRHSGRRRDPRTRRTSCRGAAARRQAVWSAKRRERSLQRGEAGGRRRAGTGMPVATPAASAASLASMMVSASPPTRATTGTQP